MSKICTWLISESPETSAWFKSCLEGANDNFGAPLIFDHGAELPGSVESPTVMFLDLLGAGVPLDRLQTVRGAAPQVPLIALTCNEDEGSRCLELGAADYLIPSQTDSRLFARATRYALERRQPVISEAGQEAPARFRRYLENAPDIIFVLDLHSRQITYLNRDELFGHRIEFLKQPGAILEIIHPADHSPLLQHWKQLAGASRSDVFVFEFRLRSQDGDWEWVQSRETVLPADDDEPRTQVLVSLSVITNRREREAAVRRYAERLQILHEIDQAIVAARSPQTIGQATLRHINRLVSCRRASVVIFNWEHKTFTIIAELPEGNISSGESASLSLEWFWRLDELQQGEVYRVDDIESAGVISSSQLLSWWHGQGVRSLVSVPLHAQRRLIGAINFGGEVADSFSPEDLVVMREVAHVLAIGIGQARLYEQAHYHARKLEQRARRLLLLNDISLAVNRPVELEAVLEAAARGLVQVIDLRQVGIVLLNKDRDAWTHVVSYSARRGASSQEINQSVQDMERVQRLVQADGVVLTEDAIRQLKLTGLEELLLEHPMDSLMVAPLQVGDEVIGVIGCDLGPGMRPFSREETDLVRTVSNLLAVKIEHIRLLDAERMARNEAEAHAANLRQRERHLTLLNSVTRATTGLQLDEMMQTVVERLGESSGAHACFITLWDEGRQQAIPAAAYGPQRDTYASYQVRPGETTLTSTVLHAGQPIQTSGNGGDAHLLSPRIESDFGATASLAIPLIAGQERLGALIISYEGAYKFSNTEVALYEQAAGQIALALSATRLFEETRRQLEELKVLHSLATAGAEARSEDALLERATQLMKQSLFPDNFGVLLFDEDTQVLYRHHTYYSGQHERKDIHIPVGEGICGHVAQSGEAIRLGEVEQDPRYVEADPQTRSELCVPLRTGAHLIGVVNVESREPNAYSEVHERLLSTFAHQLATAIEKLRLFAHTQVNLAETQALYRVSRSLIAAKNLPDLLQAVVNSVSEALPAERTVLVTIDLPRRQILDYVVDDRGDLEMPPTTFEELWQGLSGWVLREQQPLLSHKGEEDERESATLRNRRQRAGAGATIVVPLRYRDQTMGTITAINRMDGPDFTQRNVELMAVMANQAAVAIENARLFAETRRRAEELEVLGNLSASLRVADGTEEVTASLLTAATDLFNADVVAIMVPNEDRDMLVLAHSSGIPDEMRGVEYEIEGSIAGHVFTTGKAYLSENILEDSLAHQVSKNAWLQQPSQVQTAIYAPVSAGTQVTGVVTVMTSAEHALDDEDLGLLMAMAEITGSALHRAGLMETLEMRVAERTRELAQANVRLQELDRLKSKFVSDVSHELRTPITSISLYLDLMERGSPERSERYWAVLRKQTERLNHLIEDILSLSRLQMGKIDVSLTPVDLDEVVEEVLDVRRDDFIAAGLHLEFISSGPLPSVLAQPDLLGQVVDNLLSNALNYTTEGLVEVKTFLDEERGMACVSIRDSGIGISSDDLPHIFERFYRGQYAGQSNIPGTGLGLTIVEEIVQLHHGQIEVLSAEGEGTTFRFWLPYSGEA